MVDPESTTRLHQRNTERINFGNQVNRVSVCLIVAQIRIHCRENLAMEEEVEFQCWQLGIEMNNRLSNRKLININRVPI